MAMTFGDRLREARQQRQVSLQTIAKETNISVRFLEALEKGQIEKLPGGIFIRGFVRSYAAHVGLDPDQTVKDFLAEHPGARGDDEGDDEGARGGPSPFVIVMVVLALVVLAAAGFYVWGFRVAAAPTGAASEVPSAAPATTPQR